MNLSLARTSRPMLLHKHGAILVGQTRAQPGEIPDEG